MVTIKTAVALFAIAAGGFLNVGTIASPSAGPIEQPVAKTASRALADNPLPQVSHLQQAALGALLVQVRNDLQDPQSGLRLAPLRFSRASARMVEGSGNGFVLFNGVGELPVDVNVSYDLSTGTIEHVNYRVTGKAQASRAVLLGKQLRGAIADRIGARLVLEFAQQPVDFSMLEIEQLASGRDRVMISGNGITRFIGEGAAFTSFVATADKFTGKILTVQYELLQEIPSVEIASN